MGYFPDVGEQVQKIATEIIERRSKLGKTITDISRKSGVCIATIHNLEASKRSGSIESWLRVLNAEGLTLKVVPLSIDEWNSPEEADRLYKIATQAVGRKKNER